MKIFKTEYVIRKGTPFKFTTVLSTLKSNFDIPFSIRTENEAHIFLCDGEDPHESNCYWFMLQTFDGKETAIQNVQKDLYLKLMKKAAKNVQYYTIYYIMGLYLPSVCSSLTYIVWCLASKSFSKIP
jgi:hypothetical protein